jgi:CRP-like cAMP-binding protein
LWCRRGSRVLFLRHDPGRYGPRYAARVRTVRKLGPGDHFGELALLTGGPRTASVIAETSLDTIRIYRPAFRKLLLKEPEVALRLMAGLAERIAECERGLPD